MGTDHVYGRGVWLARYLRNGRPVLIAVASDGEVLAQGVVTGEADRAFVARRLRDILERLDPSEQQARIRVIR